MSFRFAAADDDDFLNTPPSSGIPTTGAQNEAAVVRNAEALEENVKAVAENEKKKFRS